MYLCEKIFLDQTSDLCISPVIFRVGTSQKNKFMWMRKSEDVTSEEYASFFERKMIFMFDVLPLNISRETLQ